MLTDQQTTAIKRITVFLKDKDKKIFKLGGYAGTGKTYLISYIIAEMQDLLEKYHVCAPTGKAASLLTRTLKDCNCSTLHSLLYKPIEYVDENTLETKLGFSDNMQGLHFDTIIVDEASMISSRILKDLLTIAKKIILVGDPGQLPPVKSIAVFTDADYVLTDIQRQALESPIIRLSKDIREGTVRISGYQYDNCKIIASRQIDNFLQNTIFKHNESIIVTGRNHYRHYINRFFRKDFSRNIEKDYQLPYLGEQVICLKNNKNLNIYNGEIFKINKINSELDSCIELSIENILTNTKVDVISSTDHFKYTYDNGFKIKSWEDKKHLDEFDFCSAITVHKSQGSEWDTVYIADDQMQRANRDFRKKWLYTAVTRAKKELVWNIVT